MIAVRISEKTRNELYFMRSLTEPGDDRRGRSAEHQLEEELRGQRHAGPAERAEDAPGTLAPVAGLLSAPPSSHPPDRPDETAVREHQPEANRVEAQRRDREDDEVLRQDHRRVLSSAESRLDQAEPRVHEEHQEPVRSVQAVSAATLSSAAVILRSANRRSLYYDIGRFQRVSSRESRIDASVRPSTLLQLPA